jgi:hypothetical protein
MFAQEANKLTATVLLRREGIDGAIRFWRKRLELYDDHQFDEISYIYEQMFLLLDLSRREEGITGKKMNLLKEFINRYQENNSEPVLQARLTLGYLVLNNVTPLTGVVDMEQAKEFAYKRKSNAEAAEKIFTEGLLRAKNTHFEQEFQKALIIVADAKNPKFPTEPKNM